MQEDKVLSDQDNHMLYFALGDNWGCIWCRRVSGDISGQNYCGVTFKVAKVCISVHRHCHSSVQEIDNASGLLE